MSYHLHYYFEESARKYRSKTAVCYDDGHVEQVLSYSEVYRQSDEISTKLAHCGGVPGAAVACLCRVSVLVPSIILGILKASYAFTFLDVELPEKYLQNLQSTTSTDFLIGEKTLFEQSTLSEDADWSIVDKFWNDTFVIAKYSKCSTATREQPEETSDMQIAYIMQTSGTTGVPKTVKVPHQCIVLNVNNLRKIFAISSEDVIFQAAPLTFDPSVVEIFLALTTGATLVLTSPVVKQIPRAVLKLLVKKSVTVIQATPSFISRLGTEAIGESLLSKDSCLRVLAFGGEECPPFHRLERWRQDGNSTQFYNLYGITEVSCWATYCRITSTGSSAVPLGDVLDGTVLEVRNELGELVDEGEGKLFVGGSMRRCLVGSETWEDVEPCQMRDTGDRVQRLQGTLRFLGRSDSVFKYHGRKVNSASLARILLSFPGVDTCHSYFSKAEQTLFFFVSLSAGQDEKKLLPSLKGNIIKECHCPFKVCTVPNMPLTSHGKVDVRALLRYTRKRKQLDDSAALQDHLTSLWKEHTMGIDNKDTSVPAEANFILCGGNSVGAISLSREMELSTSHPLPLLVEKVLNGTFADVSCYLLGAIQNQSSFTLQQWQPGSSSKRAVVEHSGTTLLQAGLVRTGPCFTCVSRFDSWHRCECGKDCTQVREISGSSEHTPAFELKWKFDLAKCVDASPLLVDYKGGDSVVFVGSHSGRFCALDRVVGKCCWELEVPDRIESSACLSKCGRYVSFGCYDHYIYCVQVACGEVQWVFQTGSEVKSSPCVDRMGGSLICGSHDKHLYCLDFETGTSLWKEHLLDASIFASPTILYAPYQLYAASLAGTLCCLNPSTGEALWNYSLAKPVFSSPVASAHGICVCSVGGQVSLLDHSGNMLWTTTTSGPIFSSPTWIQSSVPAVVVGCHDNHVYRISAKDGSLQWRQQLDAAVYSSILYLPEAEALIAATTSGTLYFISSLGGTVLSTYAFWSNIFSSPIAFSDHIIVGCRDNFVYCLGLCCK